MTTPRPRFPRREREVLREIAQRLHESDKALESQLPRFTPREREVLRRVADGYSNHEIAQKLL